MTLLFAVAFWAIVVTAGGAALGVARWLLWRRRR